MALIRSGALIRTAARFLRRPRYRWRVLTAWLFRDRLHQTTELTWVDRYPEIFARASAELGGKPGARILSFGCSTGEEVITLRGYFPQAEIVGCEINPRSRRIARRRTAGTGARLIASANRLIAAHGPYDAIFCLAVLQRTPTLVMASGMDDISLHYPFGKYEDLLTFLDSCLVPGGLLAIEYSQYRFADASIAGGYAPLPGAPVEAEPLCKFAPSGRRIADAVGEPCLHRKRASQGLLS